jgi:hypothetical protein
MSVVPDALAQRICELKVRTVAGDRIDVVTDFRPTAHGRRGAAGDGCESGLVTLAAGPATVGCRPGRAGSRRAARSPSHSGARRSASRSDRRVSISGGPAEATEARPSRSFAADSCEVPPSETGKYTETGLRRHKLWARSSSSWPGSRWCSTRYAAGAQRTFSV